MHIEFKTTPVIQYILNMAILPFRPSKVELGAYVNWKETLEFSFLVYLHPLLLHLQILPKRENNNNNVHHYRWRSVHIHNITWLIIIYTHIDQSSIQQLQSFQSTFRFFKGEKVLRLALRSASSKTCPLRTMTANSSLNMWWDRALTMASKFPGSGPISSGLK